MKDPPSTPKSVVTTVPAIAGLLFSAAAAVQFLQAEVSLGLLNWSLEPGIALLVSLSSLVVAFASSRTRDWRLYSTSEQSIIALAILIMVSHQFSPTVALAVQNNQPFSGVLAFSMGIVSWGILAR